MTPQPYQQMQMPYPQQPPQPGQGYPPQPGYQQPMQQPMQQPIQIVQPQYQQPGQQIIQPNQVISLELEDFIQGGLVNDIDAEITEIMWCGWDYNGAITDGDALFVRMMLTQLDERGNPDPAQQTEQYWSAGGKYADVNVSTDGFFCMVKPGGQKSAFTKDTHFNLLMQKFREFGMPKGFMGQYNNSLQILKGIRAHWIRQEVQKRSGLTITRRRGGDQAETVLVINRFIRAPFPLSAQQRRAPQPVAAPVGAPPPMAANGPVQPVMAPPQMQAPPPMMQPQAQPMMQPPQMQPQMQPPPQMQIPPPAFTQPAAPMQQAPPPQMPPQQIPQMQQAPQAPPPPPPQAAAPAAPGQAEIQFWTPTGNPAGDAVACIQDMLAKSGGTMTYNDVKINLFRAFSKVDSNYRNQVTAIGNDQAFLAQYVVMTPDGMVSLPQQQPAAQ